MIPQKQSYGCSVAPCYRMITTFSIFLPERACVCLCVRVYMLSCKLKFPDAIFNVSKVLSYYYFIARNLSRMR